MSSSRVLYSSIHQSPLYPGTGAATDFGSGEGEGYTVNLPVPPGTGPDEFLALVQFVVAPIAREWRPDLLCISAGYDAHRDDPLANCEVDDEGYWEMAATMSELAGGDRGPSAGLSRGRVLAGRAGAIGGRDAGRDLRRPASARGPERSRDAIPGAAGAVLAGSGSGLAAAGLRP